MSASGMHLPHSISAPALAELPEQLGVSGMVLLFKSSIALWRAMECTGISSGSMVALVMCVMIMSVSAEDSPFATDYNISLPCVGRFLFCKKNSPLKEGGERKLGVEICCRRLVLHQGVQVLDL